MPFIKLTRLERKRTAIFLVCLCCAIGAWLFLALNKKYLYTVRTAVTYKNEPQGKAYKALQPDTVDLFVEGTGWQLLFARLRLNPQSVAVSLDMLNKYSYVILSKQLPFINGQLESTQKVKSTFPDTLFFDFSKRIVKRVPVKLLSKLTFAPQYGISSPIKLSPSYVNVSGPQDQIAKIKTWFTDTLKLNDLQQNVATRIGVKQNNLSNVSVYPNNVSVDVSVDEFTEKTITVPVAITNNTDYLDVKLYPKQVQVTFKVALSSYSEITSDFITAGVNLNDWKIYRHKKLSVNTLLFPGYCQLVKIVPNKVDFIIEK